MIKQNGYSLALKNSLMQKGYLKLVSQQQNTKKKDASQSVYSNLNINESLPMLLPDNSESKFQLPELEFQKPNTVFKEPRKVLHKRPKNSKKKALENSIVKSPMRMKPNKDYFSSFKDTKGVSFKKQNGTLFPTSQQDFFALTSQKSLETPTKKSNQTTRSSNENFKLLYGAKKTSCPSLETKSLFKGNNVEEILKGNEAQRDEKTRKEDITRKGERDRNPKRKNLEKTQVMGLLNLSSVDHLTQMNKFLNAQVDSCLSFKLATTTARYQRNSSFKKSGQFRISSGSYVSLA